MAKKIFVNDEDIEKVINSLEKQKETLIESLRKSKMQDDSSRKFNIEFAFNEKDDRKAEVIISPKAWVKMFHLICTFKSEVEWHGTVKRLDKSSFLIEDILIFPHEVTSTTVTSDQTKYSEWLDTLDDETFNALRFHGHSHVNMGVTPSGIDMEYRRKMLANLGTPTGGKDIFYIFLIFNKSCEVTGEIYDLTNNALYDTDDITIDTMTDDDSYLSEFASEVKRMVTEVSYNYKTGFGYGSGGSNSTTSKSQNQSAPHHSSKKKNKTKSEQSSVWDDIEGYDDDEFYGYSGYGHNAWGR